MQTTWLASRTPRLCCLKSVTAILNLVRRWNDGAQSEATGCDAVLKNFIKRHFQIRLISQNVKYRLWGGIKKTVYHTVSLKYNESSLYVFITKNFRYLPLKHGNILQTVTFLFQIVDELWKEGISMKMLPDATQIEDLIIFFFLSSLSLLGSIFSGFGPSSLHQPYPTPHTPHSHDDNRLSGTTLWCSSAHGQRVDFVLLTM